MSKTEQLAQDARRLRDRQAAAQRETSQPAPVKRVKKVRRTVDLSAVDHAGLTAWCAQTAIDLGAARISGQDVLRGLVTRLLTDQALAEQIRADLRAALRY